LPALVVAQDVSSAHAERGLDARALILQRRSAIAFDGRSAIDLPRFIAMLSRVMPGRRAPWDALWWTPRIHLALFVHRVDGLDPGLYVLPREAAALGRLKGAVHREFLWERAADPLPLFRLLRGDCRALAQRLSCDQDIAADGFFSLGMIADFDRSLREHGPSFYRHLFWESGVVGQVLYLEAEAAGARATGIGCFYDDPVHDVLGLEGHAFQSLYHFTVGVPIEDTRLTTEPGYSWESIKPSAPPLV
jgi:nitroreductase